MGSVPNAPKTPLRSMRIPDDEWNAAGEAARANGTNLTAVIRAALRDYADTTKTPPTSEGEGR